MTEVTTGSFPSVTHSPWAIHRRLYGWVLDFAHHKYAALALFLISFAESSFFPIAPDILQIALTLENRSRAWYYAFINSVASVLGGIVGYMIGFWIWNLTSPFFFHYIFSEETFQRVGNLYHSWDFWAIFVAAFTPIPYKVFTIAAGVFHISPLMFIIASIVGRSARFFLVAFLLRTFGASVRNFIEKYFNLLTITLVVLMSLGFVILNYL